MSSAISAVQAAMTPPVLPAASTPPGSSSPATLLLLLLLLLLSLLLLLLLSMKPLPGAVSAALSPLWPTANMLAGMLMVAA